MIRLGISVEGQTEEEFVKRILAGPLRAKKVEPTPILIGRAGENIKGEGGGDVTVARLVEDMACLYRSFNFVTSLVDFYGFRDKDDKTVEELEEHIHQELKDKIAKKWDETKIFPYVQIHEVEGLLFSKVDVFKILPNVSMKSIRGLQKIRSKFETPEDINDSNETAPSKRIMRLIPRYRKRGDSPLLAEEIGLDTIRAECPRFNAWVGRMEALGA